MSTAVILAAGGGLLAGPLVRVLVWRSAASSAPRATCPGCDRAAAWTPTAPFTGHCPACGIESFTAAGFAIAAHVGGSLLQILALCWLAAVTTALALIDAAVKRLPDRLTVPAFAGTAVLLTPGMLCTTAPSVYASCNAQIWRSDRCQSIA